MLAGTTWQYTVNLAQANGAPIEALKPVEGATGWSDTWMLSTKAAHPNCMKLWMDWITSPWANAQVAEWWGEAPSNRESCGLTANPDHCAIYHADETDYWTDVWYWTTPTVDVPRRPHRRRVHHLPAVGRRLELAALVVG